MDQAAIRVERLEKTFRVARTPPGLLGAVRSLVGGDVREVHAVDGISLQHRARRDGRLHRPERRRQVDHDQDADRHPACPTAAASRCRAVPSPQRSASVARRIGVVFGQRTQLWWDLPLTESLDLLRYIYRVPRSATRARCDDCRLLDLEPFSTRRCASSRSASACAATSRPRCCTIRTILFLDEPTIGLDVVAKHRIRDFLRTINREQGATVLLTTHDMADVEQLAPAC